MSFVDEGPSLRDLYKTNEQGERSTERRSPSSSTTSSGSGRDSRKSGASPAPADVRRFPDLERSTLVAIISPTAQQCQLFSMFLGTIASDNPVQLAPTFHCHGIWLAQLATRTEVSSTLLHAIRAMSLLFLGRQARDDNLLQNSRLIYGNTLLKLNKSLQDSTEGLSSDTLSATLLLTFYEMLNCTKDNSWIRHAGGAAHLMRLRGPARYRTDFDKSMFQACKYSMVLESYATGKSCFLSLPPWRQLSQEIHDSVPRRDAFDNAREAFFQEIVQQPGYVTESVEYMAGGGQDRSVLQDLVRRGHMHRSNHKAIHKQCAEALRDAGQEPTEVPSSVHDKVFPIVYQFPGILVASFYCTYWSLLKVLNIALIGLEAKLSALDSGVQMSRNHMTPTGMLAARDMLFNREEVTRLVVAGSLPAGNTAAPAPTRIPIVTDTRKSQTTLPDRTSSSPVRDAAVGTRSSESQTPAVSSPTDYPTMSPSDTAKRRQLYMAENKYCAHQICKSVEKISTAAFLGPIFLIFSMKACNRMLDDPEEKDWVVRKMKLLAKTWGLAKDETERE